MNGNWETQTVTELLRQLPSPMDQVHESIEIVKRTLEAEFERAEKAHDGFSIHFREVVELVDAVREVIEAKWDSDPPISRAEAVENAKRAVARPRLPDLEDGLRSDDGVCVNVAGDEFRVSTAD